MIYPLTNIHHSLLTTVVVIYTTTDWWKSCTGNSPVFGANNPLWIGDYASTLGPLPAGWKYTSFWQYDDKGPNPGDADLWNGDEAGLKRYVFSSKLVSQFIEIPIQNRMALGS